MKETITKTDLLAFAKSGATTEAEKLLGNLRDWYIYRIKDYKYNCHLCNDETDNIYMSLSDGLFGEFCLTLPFHLFDLNALHRKIVYDSPLKLGLNWDTFELPLPRLNMTSSWPKGVGGVIGVESIQYNKAKGITTVVFRDGDVQMAKLGAEDEYDPCVGVAICIAAHQFGSKTAFKKYVEKNLKVKEAKAGGKKK